MQVSPAQIKQQLQHMVQPWLEAVGNPQQSQEAVLLRLLKGYARTTYGREHGAESTGTLIEYRSRFPVVTYDEIRPLIQRVMAGETDLLLYQPPIGWAITRGTSHGESKFIPMTADDLGTRTSAARAVVHYALRTGRYDVFSGVNLNLNFPSVVGTVKVGDQVVDYGYSSGIYVKHVSASTPIRSLPSQDEIDALGGGKTKTDWERRFELAYERCRGERVTLVGGVAPVAIKFAQYVHRAHRVYPKDIWQTQIMTLGSVPGINTKYAPALRALYGPTDIAEIYGATEGMFGQQRDERRGWVPNYDLFFFEVQTRRGVIMLHEMRPGERGSLIVSTVVLPRYRIGDTILAFEPPYFRCIGRDGPLTYIRYLWGQFAGLDFGPI